MFLLQDVTCVELGSTVSGAILEFVRGHLMPLLVPVYFSHVSEPQGVIEMETPGAQSHMQSRECHRQQSLVVIR